MIRKTILSASLLMLAIVVFAGNNTYNFLTGTYTLGTGSKGIYSFTINMTNGRSDTKVVAANAENPSYLSYSPDRKFVYAVNEQGDNSTVSAYRVDAASGQLIPLNKTSSGGADPCFVSVTDSHVAIANYSGGSIALFGRNPDGSLTGVRQLIQHTGKSVLADRQGEPHVHQTLFTPDGRYLLCNDLGTDYLTVYAYHPASGGNVLVAMDSLRLKAGSGPRHMAFGRDGKIVYVIQEIDGTLSTLSFGGGKLKLISETSVVRRKKVTTGAADIHLSPDGRFLYATNRGTANDITCFAIAPGGKLRYVGQYSVKGAGPRNFAVTRDGKYILVANQTTGQIVVFRRNIKTGNLTDTGFRIDIPAPVCLVER